MYGGISMSENMMPGIAATVVRVESRGEDRQWFPELIQFDSQRPDLIGFNSIQC